MIRAWAPVRPDRPEADVVDRLGIKITNSDLQKLLYFAHGVHLTQTKNPQHRLLLR